MENSQINKIQWNYVNLSLVIVLYSVSFYSLFHIFLYARNLTLTLVFIFIFGILSGLGVTAGAHRLWSHRSYKAKGPFRFFLMLCFSMSGQNSLYQWVRDHRVHHKYSDTDSDPHNVNRGFWFSHVGWLTMSRHPEVKKQCKEIPLNDILEDKVVQFHLKYFWFLKITMAFVLPTICPIILWNEDIFVAILSQCFLRYFLILNATWSVNSFAHMFGNKPYDKSLKPSENAAVSYIALGEGWHNYHHAFPYDYRTSEYGAYSTNFTALLLDFAAKQGWVYDRKTPKKEYVKQRMQDKGDGTITSEKQTN